MMENERGEKALVAEIQIPKSLFETAIEVTLSSIVVIFVVLALFNLTVLRSLPKVALFASVIWLLFVFLIVRRSSIEDGGVRQFMINRGGVFARYQFAEIAGQHTGQQTLCFGYKLFGKRWYYLKVRYDAIKTVDWGPGQATDFAGRDMNDWHVVIWFDKDLATTMNWVSSDRPRYGLYVIGPSRERQKTEALGNLFIEFLRNADVAAARNDDSTLSGLVGKSGIVSISLDPVGKIILDGVEYSAHSNKSFIGKSAMVKVINNRGLSLYVEAIEIDSMGKQVYL